MTREQLAEDLDALIEAVHQADCVTRSDFSELEKVAAIRARILASAFPEPPPKPPAHPAGLSDYYTTT